MKRFLGLLLLCGSAFAQTQTVNIPLQVTVTPTTVTVAVGAQTSVIPVPVAPPVGPADAVVLSAGKFYWSGNFNYNGMKEADGVLCAGQIASSFTANSTGGGGGWLPYRSATAVPQPGHFDTTGYNFYVLTMAPTRAGQVWQAVVPNLPNGSNGIDQPVPGAVSVNVNNYGPAPQPGVYAVYKIPLHAGGYNMPTNVIIWKLGVQDQMPYSVAANAPGNVTCIADARFTAQ